MNLYFMADFAKCMKRSISIRRKKINLKLWPLVSQKMTKEIFFKFGGHLYRKIDSNRIRDHGTTPFSSLLSKYPCWLLGLLDLAFITYILAFFTILMVLLTWVHTNKHA